MVESINADAVKKRLMFLKGEDLYFFSYNILIILNSLSCVGRDSLFKDHRKLSFLIDIISDPRLVHMLNEWNAENILENRKERQILVNAYTDGMMRLQIINRLLFALAQRGLVELKVNKEKGCFDLYLYPADMPAKFFSDFPYSVEFENIRLIKNIIPRIKTITLRTFLMKVFDRNGVNTWLG